MKLLKTSSKGFTLIELLIVIAILGILAATVLVAMNPAQRVASGRNARVRADLAALGSEANIYSTDTGLDSACAQPGYPTIFNAMCGTSTFRPNGSPATPTGGIYTITGTTTAIGISGPAFNDGATITNDTSEWCWRSATGQIVSQPAANACP